MDALTEEKRNQIIDQVGIALTSTGTALTDALAAIFELAQQDEVKLALTDPNLAFIDRLEYLLREEPGGMAVAWSISVVTRLSASVHHNKEYLAGEYRGLCPEFVRLITQPNVKNNIYVFFANCVLNSATIPYLLSEHLGLVEAAKAEIQSNPEYKFVYTFFANAVTTMTNGYCAYFIQLGIHELIVNRLIRAGPDPTTWPDRNTGAVYRSMGFVTSFSTLADGCNALRQLNRKQYFLSFLEATAVEKERMQASIILANLYGQDEEDMASVSQSLLTKYPNVLQLLVNLLASIIDYNAHTSEARSYRAMGLAFGVTKMRDASASLLKLAMNEQNKAPMITHASFLAYVLRAIQLFIDNAGQCYAIYQGFQSYAGGGGGDFDSIQNLIELLLQLSFLELPEKDPIPMKESDTEEQTDVGEKKVESEHVETMETAREEKKESTEDEAETLSNIEEEPQTSSFRDEMMEKLRAILELPEERNLPFATRQCAIELLTRLETIPNLLLTTVSPRITYLTENNHDFDEAVDAEENDEEEDEHEEEEHFEDEENDEGFDEDNDNNDNHDNLATTTTNASANDPPPNPQHIMISCASNISSSKREMVMEMGMQLRRYGYDTWIDQEGSGLIPGLIGREIVDTEVLTDAVDHSYAVIICISPEFKNNTLCRFIADYAHQRRHSHDLKIYFIMLDANYHTSSTPLFVDGWLGLMIGVDLWHPLWETSHLSTTTDILAGLIGAHGKVFSDGRANNFVPPPRASHVLFSYAPNTIHRELIEELRIRMKMFNYDVWSYEQGSLLVPSIFSTSVTIDYDEQYLLREALQCSQTMIIFISKEYRDHPDCRLQANAAYNLAESGHLKILYVMLDENYHTASKPEMIDGWLGYLLGLEQWYPLWTMDQMEQTMLLLIDEIGANSKASQNQRYRGYIEKSKSKMLSNPVVSFVPPLPASTPTANAVVTPASNTPPPLYETQVTATGAGGFDPVSEECIKVLSLL